MPGQCNINDVVYRGHLPIPPPPPGQQDNNNNRQQQQPQTYTGCSVNFKKRYGKHKRAVRLADEKQTTFSSYIWKNFNQNGKKGDCRPYRIPGGPPLQCIARARPVW